MRISNLCRPAVLALAVTLAGCQSSQIDDLSTASTGDKLPASVAAPPDGSASAPGAVEESARALADAGSANVIASYVPPESGTELTFRNNWSSLPPVITYRVAGTVALGGKTYLKMTSIKGQSETVSAYYDTANFALKGYRDKNDKPILTYKPVEERYRFPLRPGDRWVSSWRSYDHRKEKEITGGGIVEVIGFETLKLPAGTFRAMKVKMPVARGLPRGMTHFIWFAPKLGVTVKEEVGNGQMNWTQVLEKVSPPAAGS
ncbi:MAG: hypothetical protein KDJ80_15630 [Nitratireductor sp.]|nr:hypothetical protein [Nitratireductor sp.]